MNCRFRAVIEAVNADFWLNHGGPGTGKTTTINTIIRYFEKGDMDILAGSPDRTRSKKDDRGDRL